MAKVAGLPIDPVARCPAHLRDADAPSGVPTAVISKWLGHATASFTMATYVHCQDDALTAAGAMYGSIIRGSQSGV